MTRVATPDRPPRVGTFNVLYFPDADEAQSDDEDGTDIAWLACLISGLEVDLLALQEFKNTPRALDKRSELIAQLNQRTGGDWHIETVSCLPANVQHPGFLYDRRRVTASHVREIPALSPDGACSNRVSPGLAGYFSIANGLDFHLVSVHLEAYGERRSLENRARSVALMAQVAREAQALVPDSDVLFAGDFNTTGCKDCEPAVTSEEEIQTVRTTFMREPNTLRLVGADLTCSKPGGGLLDHFAISTSFSELPAGSLARVGGICAETQCARLREWHEEATERVSDHCPLSLELSAVDDD